MSFYIAIDIPKIEQTEAQRIFDRINTTNVVRFNWQLKNHQHFEIISEHEFLTEEADWDADFWDLQSNIRPYLEQAVVRFSDVYAGPFKFSAIWVSDSPDTTLKVSVPELLSLIRNNQIGTKTVYVVNN